MACDVLGDKRGPVRCLNELDAALVTEFKEDLGRYRAYGESYRRILLNPAVWCIFWYRLGRWVYSPDRNLLVRCLGKPLHLIGATWIEAFLQMRINVRAEIGPGLLIAHCGGITLHPEVVIGRHCDIAHHVTLGTRGGGSHGAPKLGKNVYVGTNAVLIGPIHVGDGARIAANSLVNRDVPAGATVMGVPAVVVKQRTVKEIAEAPEVAV
ncbi:MAG: serine acetyltransferase [Acidobacteriaceae bacterium]|nr:serine acetyltransferase [Acidobacteriaceae bacterium]